MPWYALPRADAIIAAVAHKPLVRIGVEELARKLIRGGVFVDVKAAFDPDALRGAGLTVWRLWPQSRRGALMKTVTLDVRSPGDAMAEALAAAKSGRPQKTGRISFATPELLWRVLTVKRWEILKALCGAGPMSIREVARRVGRDVKAVHADVTALLMAGVIDRTQTGQIEFPYDAVKVES